MPAKKKAAAPAPVKAREVQLWDAANKMRGAVPPTSVPMNEPAKFNNVVSFLWAIADLLNGAFKKSEFQKIILPFTVLRRLDYALEKTKEKVLETERTLKEKGLENRHGQLCRAAGYAFYNTSKFTYESLLHDDTNLALNLRQYVMGFSPNVREIFAAFNFDDTIRDLSRVNLLYLLMERFNEKSKVDLRPASMSNHEMGYVFEHLLRKFNEALNENPGEHFTPRDGIRLMVDLVLMLDTELAGSEGVARTVYDCGCGTGGILSITKEHILQINPQAKVFLYGQELNPFTWAIARADMLILEPEGKDAENIKLGSTLSNDQLSDMRFDLQFVNPPYGYREIKVLRPLKLRFTVNAESLARLDAQAAFKNLAVSKKKAAAEQKREEQEGLALQAEIRTALQTLAGKTFICREKFIAALGATLKKAGLKLKAPIMKAILAGIGERDETAEVCRDSDGNPEPDTDLNDTENVPLKEKVETYFAREVTPHVPDAWMDPTYCDAKDGKVGRVGYEIPFNRHFYVFQPPRPLSAIDADLKASTDRILKMIGGLTK